MKQIGAMLVMEAISENEAGFTLDAYTHVTGEMQKDAVNRMGSFMAQQAV